jgi:hypothetical protein
MPANRDQTGGSPEGADHLSSAVRLSLESCPGSPAGNNLLKVKIAQLRDKERSESAMPVERWLNRP